MFANSVEPCQRQDELAVERDLSADEPGVATLGHQRGLGLVGQFEDRLHFAN